MTLEGRLLEDGVVPIEGRSLTLSLGAQSCTGTTDAAGFASCTIVYSRPARLAASSRGIRRRRLLPAVRRHEQERDRLLLPRTRRLRPRRRHGRLRGTSDDRHLVGAGLGIRERPLGRRRSAAFKGFAATVPLPTSTPPAACAGPWTTRPGNSASPPATVPSYMGVLVAGHVAKSGSAISGNTTSIVVVATEPGYGPARATGAGAGSSRPTARPRHAVGPRGASHRPRRAERGRGSARPAERSASGGEAGLRRVPGGADAGRPRCPLQSPTGPRSWDRPGGPSPGALVSASAGRRPPPSGRRNLPVPGRPERPGRAGADFGLGRGNTHLPRRLRRVRRRRWRPCRDPRAAAAIAATALIGRGSRTSPPPARRSPP